MSQTTPTDNAWLDEIIGELLDDYPVNPPVKLANGDVWRSNTTNAELVAKAKQAILTHIDTVCREARIDELVKLTQKVECLREDCETDHSNLRRNYVQDRLTQLDPNKDTDNE